MAYPSLRDSFNGSQRVAPPAWLRQSELDTMAALYASLSVARGRTPPSRSIESLEVRFIPSGGLIAELLGVDGERRVETGSHVAVVSAWEFSYEHDYDRRLAWIGSNGVVTKGYSSPVTGQNVRDVLSCKAALENMIPPDHFPAPPSYDRELIEAIRAEIDVLLN